MARSVCGAIAGRRSAQITYPMFCNPRTAPSGGRVGAQWRVLTDADAERHAAQDSRHDVMPAARAGRAVWGHDAVCLDGLAGLGRGAGQLCPAGSGRNAPGSMTNRLVAGAGNSGAAAVLVAIRIAVLGVLRVWPSCMSAERT